MKSRIRTLSLTLLTSTVFVAACSEPPQPVGTYFAGQVVFADELADIEEGCVFVNVYNQRGDRIPALCRKYELGEPGFHEGGEGLVLDFELDETHNMAGTGVPLGDDLQMEVRYDPDGAVETKAGVRSAWVKTRSGDARISVRLDASAEVAAPSSRPTSRPAPRPASQPVE